VAQIQCQNCNMTFPHEAALREHEKVSICQKTILTPAQRQALKTQRFAQHYGSASGRISFKDFPTFDDMFITEKRRPLTPEEVDQRLSQLEERYSGLIEACRALDRTNKFLMTKIDGLEKMMNRINLDPKLERAFKDKVDYTTWVDEEDCMTDETRGVPQAREKVKF